MSTRSPLPGKADRKRQFRETARDILHMAKVKRQMGQAVDTAGTLARAMEQAWGLEDALKGPADPEADIPSVSVDPVADAMARHSGLATRGSGSAGVREERGRWHHRDAGEVGTLAESERRIARDVHGLWHQDMESLLRARGLLAG